jgi:transglutaminase-like putative cysteine protease
MESQPIEPDASGSARMPAPMMQALKLRALAAVFVLVITPFCGGAFCSQDWGKIDQGELNLATIAEDPDADAVVLFDKGKYLFGYLAPVTLERHTRVKVLTKRGVEHASISIPFLHGEKVTNVEGHTFTPDGRKIKLNKKQVFVKKGTHWNEVAFTLPGVEQGCILEYRYQKRSHYTYILGPWYFQDEIHTKMSQVAVEIEPGWAYTYNLVNPRDAEIEAATDKGPISKHYTWTLHNIPPLDQEDFVDCLRDHLTAMYFERINPLTADSKTRDPVEAWKEIGELMDDFYGRFKRGRREVHERALQLTQDLPADSAKVASIYDYVRRDVAWNGERGIVNFDDDYLKNVLSESEGSAVEKNLFLIQLLEGVGIEAYPMLIGTRDYGRTLTNLPGLLHFNHLIAYVEVAEGGMLLDAVDRSCPFKVLPANDLVTHGLLLDGERSGLAEIHPPQVNSVEHIVTRCNIMEDGGLACSSVIARQGHCAVYTRKQVAEKGKEKFIQEMALLSIPTGSVSDARYAALDSVERTLQINFTLSVPDYAQVAGEDMYFNPTLFARLESNPFTDEERNLPVNFPYPLTKVEETQFSIPEGFEAGELPEEVHKEIPGAEFIKRFSLEGNLVRCYRQFTLSQWLFPVEQYGELRSFHQEVASADQLQIILTRKRD